MPYRKLSKCHQDVLMLIEKVANILSLRDFEYTILIGGEDIDSYYSGLYNIHIKGFKNGQKIKYCCVMKYHPDSETRAVFREHYKREVAFYHKIVPRYIEIQRKFNIIEGLRMKFPNCIFASDEYEKEAIVVMGLLEHGFKLHDRLQRMDLDHVLLVMKYLAKMHALSFVLEKWKPKEFEEIKNLYSEDVQYSDPNRESPMKCFYDASVRIVSNPVIRQNLQELGPKISTILHKCTLPVPRYSVICHGDCWNNNIFYKSKDKRPVEVILIDFQLMRFSLPATDIAYMLYMSTDGEFLSKHYETALNIYYGTLAAVLRECNLNVEEIYPKKVFESHLQEYSVLGLVEALISMMIITAPLEDAVKMTEIKDPFCNKMFCESQHSIMFKKRVNDVVDDFFLRNYSLDAILRK